MQHDERLERLITQATRGAPVRSAPATLAERVQKAIDARAAQPWWRKDFGRWPVGARVFFLILGAGLVYLAIGAPLWLWESSRGALPAEISVMQTLAQTARVIMNHLPSVFVYSALVAIAMLYAALFGVGAIAYRSLFGRGKE